MKYDILEPYKEFLYDQLTANTARKYYSCMVKLLQGVEINRVEELSLEYLQKELPQRFRTKNEFSAAKNALRLFGECYPQPQMPAKEYFKEESLKKRNYTKKPGKVIHLKTTMRKINQIENPKLKYAYRLAVISGLRLSELADLRPSDLAFTEGRITVTVRNGKGGTGVKLRAGRIPICMIVYRTMFLGYRLHRERSCFIVKPRCEKKQDAWEWNVMICAAFMRYSADGS